MRALRVLMLEDSDDDALLVRGELEEGGFALTWTRVDHGDGVRAALEDADWDLILSDYSMPQFTALDALAIVQRSRQPDVPFVIVSGSIGEESAVAALKAGASNYVLKHNLAQLLPVVERELKDARTRKERQEAFVALEQAVRARDEFLSIASHELKTPLTTLRLQTQSLLRAGSQERGRLLENEAVIDRMRAIERNAERLTTLIERLLHIARVTTGRMRLSRETVDLVSLVRLAVDTMAETLRGAGCEVSIVAPPQVLGDWDRERVEMVVTNLLDNAAKYGARHPIRVEIADGGESATLRVLDEGIGVSTEDQQRIFGRFERAVPEHHYGGFGVGLWLAEQIVHAHGGHISVESTRGRGSTFTITLPKRTGHESAV